MCQNQRKYHLFEKSSKNTQNLYKARQNSPHGVPGQPVVRRVATEINQEAEVVLHIVTMFHRMINQKMETVMRVTVSN